MDDPLNPNDFVAAPNQMPPDQSHHLSDTPPPWYQHDGVKPVSADEVGFQDTSSVPHTPPQFDSNHAHQSPSRAMVNLLKIGELAKHTGEPVATIRYWVSEGLLQVNSFSPGGYQLFDPSMIERVKEIRRLQTEHRWTIAEIKQHLDPPQ